jgi:hypothetical protein
MIKSLKSDLKVGLRELEKKMKLADAMRKKTAEYKMQELQNKAEINTMTKERLSEIAKKHGVIIALDDKLKIEVEKIKKEYNIKETNVIRELLTEQNVLSKKNKINHEKLGLLSYQRVMMQKEETGGLLLLIDVFDLVNTGILKNRITIDDLEKSLHILKKKNVIPEIKTLESGVLLISFFPVQFTSDQTEILKFVESKGYCTLADICSGLAWSETRSSRALQNLEATGIAKTDESFRSGKRWFFPKITK